MKIIHFLVHASLKKPPENKTTIVMQCMPVLFRSCKIYCIACATAVCFFANRMSDVKQWYTVKR